jgi:undecaprenyl diphosphate synthase
VRIIESSQIDLVRSGEIPNHIGVIMDGNGRWAQMRDLSRSEGHAAAEAAVVATVDACLDLGVRWLTAYAFSTENWTRDQEEVAFLMRFDEWLLRKERRIELRDKGVQVRFIGRIDDERIPPDSRAWLTETMEMTAHNDRLVLAIAFNYGGRAELVDAVNSLMAAGVGPVDEQQLHDALYASDMPEMDLVFRTSSEHRLSNFFPWHASYAELVFPDTLWPDVREWHIYSAVAEYQQRRRRRGAASVE